MQDITEHVPETILTCLSRNLIDVTRITHYRRSGREWHIISNVTHTGYTIRTQGYDNHEVEQIAFFPPTEARYKAIMKYATCLI